jgi:cyclopropane fatty-acyl-phospholipid synthase-like methyltransferase
MLDLGCGTGTNVIYMARHGWKGVGVDFSALAILQARWKAWRARLHCRFHRSGVTDMPFLTKPFDLILDIGCLHSIPYEQRAHYAAEVRRLVVPGGLYMLYAFLPRDDRSARGITPDEVAGLFTPDFVVKRREGGDDPTGPLSAWYWLEKVAD